MNKIVSKIIPCLSHKIYRKNGAKITWSCLLFCFMVASAFLITGCQPTPSQTPVVNKGQTDLTQQLQQSAASNGQGTGKKLADLDIPNGNYKYTTKNDAGTLTINVDAQVIAPATGKMPSAKAVPMQFTQQMVTGMFNYLFPGQKPIVENDTLAKSDIEKMILNLEKTLASGKEDGETLTQDNIDAINAQISKWQEQEKTAPDTENASVVSDGTMEHNQQLGCMRLSVWASGNTIPHMLVLTNYDGKGSAAMDQGPGSSKIEYTNTTSTFTMDKSVKITTKDKLPEKAAGMLKTSLQDAIAKADGLFAAAGVKDVALFSSYLVDNHGTGNVDNNYAPASEYAYKLYYTRTLQGVIIASTGEAGTSVSSAGLSSYDVPWGQESIMVTVGNNGIEQFQWYHPCETTDMLTDNANMIDFKTAVDRFEKSVLYTYEPMVMKNGDSTEEKTFDVSIDEICLAPLRLKQKDHPGEYAGIYTPAYLFYGQTKLHEESAQSSQYAINDSDSGLNLIFAINAVDGSTINPMESY